MSHRSSALTSVSVRSPLADRTFTTLHITSWLFALLTFEGTHLFAQVGLSEQQARATYRLSEDDSFGGVQWWELQSRRGEKRDFQFAFQQGAVAAVRIDLGYRANERDVTNALQTFGGRLEDGRRVRVRWKSTTAFLTAFPPFGRAYSWLSPVKRTVGQERTITFDPETGRVLGVSPWSDLSVPTGEFRLNQATESYFVEVLVSDDGSMYAVLVATPAGFISRGVVIRPFIICDASFLWEYASRSISEVLNPNGRYRYGFDSYEDGFDDFVPETYHEQARIRRLVGLASGFIDTSALPNDRLTGIAEKTFEFGEPARAVLQERLSRELNAQAPDVQSRRINVMVDLFGSAAIEPLVSLRAAAEQRRRRQVVDEVETLLRRIADEENLPPPPPPQSGRSEWSAWTDRVTEPGP